MGEPNNIEDKLRDKLNSREFIIKDSWQADMDAKLATHNSTNKGGMYLRFLSGLVLILLIGTALAFFNGDSKLKSEYSPRIENISTNGLIDNSLKTSNPLENFAERSTNSSQENDIISPNNSVKNLSKKGDSQLVSIPEKNNITDKTKSVKDTEHTDKAIASTHPLDTKTRESADENPVEHSELTPKSAQKNSQTNSHNTAELNTKSSSSSGFDNKEITSEIHNKITDQSSTEDAPKSHYGDFEINEVLTNNSLQSLSLKTVKLSEFSLSNELTNSTYLVPPPNNFKPSWNLSANAGISSSNINRGAFLSSLNSFNGTIETNRINSFQMDLRLSKDIGKNFEIQSGVSTTVYGEEIVYSDELIISSGLGYEYFETGSWIIDSMTVDTILIIDSTYVTMTDSLQTLLTDTIYSSAASQSNGKRAYSYLEIPLGVTYKFNLSRRSFGLVSPEISLGILTRTNGFYYDEKLSRAVNRSFSINSSVALGYGYKLNERLSILTMYRVRKPLGNLNSSDELIRKYWSHGFTLGLKVKF